MSQKVLIVEDDPINMLIAEKLFSKHFNISKATNGHEALDLVANSDFDVILMDINLGDETLDGIDVMKKIRTELQKPAMKIYAVTSYAMPEDRERFLKEGFDEYFTKPINKQAILERLNQEFKAN